MTPVFQTKFQPVGNCLAAVVASVLDLPIDEVPNFEVLGETLWKDVLSEWLLLQGYLILPSRELLKRYKKGGEWPVLYDNVPHICYGEVAGMPHVVILANGRLVHDPTPKGAGLDTLSEVWVLRHRKESAAAGGMNMGELLRLDHIDYSPVPEIPDF